MLQLPSSVAGITPMDLNFASLSPRGVSSLAENLPTDMGLPSAQTPSGIANVGQIKMPGTSEFGFNPQTIGLALNGIGTIGQLWAGFKALGLAKEQFNYQKNVTDTNMANQIKSYNTSLADRARSRAVTEGRSQEDADAYVAKNSMTRAPM